MEKFVSPVRAMKVDGAVSADQFRAAVSSMRLHGIPNGARVLYDWMVMVIDAADINEGDFVALEAKVQ